MAIDQILYATRRPYTWKLQKSIIDQIRLACRRLDFDMELQTQTNWCWAATSTSVSHFYWPWSSWTQCKVANAELGRSDCCSATVPGACNVPWFLDQALDRTQNFVSISGVVSFETVRAEIDAGRPVGARIGWNGGGGHFMVIYGYCVFGGVEYFDIDDPIYGKVHISVSDFTNNYQGSGSWTHTYMTKSYFPIIIFKPFYVREPILEIIWNARPLLDRSGGGAQQAAEPDDDWRRASLALAHPVYTLGLDRLLSGDFDLSAEQPAAVRVLESAEGELRAVFDVADEPEPRVLQMSASQAYLDRLSRGLDQAVAFLQEQEAGEEEVELRLLRVPALNFEALHLFTESGRLNWLVPFISLGALEPYAPVPAEEAMEILRNEAGPLAEMDDRMGA